MQSIAAGNISKLYSIKVLKWFMVYMPVLVLFYDEQGLKASSIFILQSFYNISLALFEIPSGYFSDRFGRKPSMVIGCVIGFIGFSVFCFASGMTAFAVALTLVGIGNSFISGTDSAMLYDSLAADGREQDFIRYEGRTVSLGNFAEAFAGIAGGLIAYFSYRHTFYVQAALAFVAIPIALSLKEPPRKQAHPENSLLGMVSVLNMALIKDSVLKWTVLLSAFLGASTLTMAWFAQVYFKAISLPEYTYGILWATLNMVVGISAWYTAWIQQKISYNWLLLILILSLGCGYFVFAGIMHPVALVFLYLFYFVRGIATPLLREEINRVTDAKIRATVLSVRSLVIRLGASLIWLLIAWIMDHHSLQAAFTAAGIIFTGGALLSIIKRRKLS